MRNHALRESHRGNVPNEWFGLPASRGEAEQKKADYYFTGDACDRGHIDIRGGNHHRCLQCCRDDALVNNKTDERKVWKRSYNKRPEVRQRENAYVQNRFRNDSTFRFRVNVSSRIANFFARRKSAGKAEITEKLLGCSCKEFRKWIEDQMDDYMTLDNYGREGWHLDHWRPIMSFKEFDIEVEREVQLVAFNWRNYQPLRGDENLSKNDNWDEKMEAEWTERMRSLGWKGELFLCFAKDP